MTSSTTKKQLSRTALEIAGIEHELFLRALTSIGHDQISPISVVRMNVAILKRTLQKGELESHAIQDQLDKIDRHLQESIVLIRNLKLWNVDAKSVADPLTVITQASKLMGIRLSMRNISIDFVPQAVAAEKEVRHSIFLYFWLAIFSYFEDIAQLPASITIEKIVPNSAIVRLIHTTSVTSIAPDTSISAMPANRLIISQELLQVLASHYGIVIDFNIDFSQSQINIRWG